MVVPIELLLETPYFCTVTKTNKDPQALKKGPNRDPTFCEIGTQ